MDSKETETMIAELNNFLKTKHPFSVLQFITGMMIGWTHFDKEKQPSESEIDLVWNNYFDLLRNSIDRRLFFISNRSLSNVRGKTVSIPPQVYEEKKLDEVINLLGSMPPDDALNFIVEVTVNWSFSIPKNYLSLLPASPQDESDGAVANAIYEWLVRYFDLWH